MLAVISPAKKLDFSPAPTALARTRPALLKRALELNAIAKKLTAAELGKLMKLSQPLSELNFERFQSFQIKPAARDSKQAALAFDGDTYAGLRAREFSEQELNTAQSKLRILSGLYGLLRPLDVIQPYRLEMGTRLHTEQGSTLYAFWGTQITKELNKALKPLPNPVLVNLASIEYFGAVDVQSLKAPVLTCTFQEVKNGIPKVIGFSAKRARGMMARFIIEHDVTDPLELRSFAEAGYGYTPAASTEWNYVFRRKA